MLNYGTNLRTVERRGLRKFSLPQISKCNSIKNIRLQIFILKLSKVPNQLQNNKTKFGICTKKGRIKFTDVPLVCPYEVRASGDRVWSRDTLIFYERCSRWRFEMTRIGLLWVRAFFILCCKIWNHLNCTTKQGWKSKSYIAK